MSVNYSRLLDARSYRPLIARHTVRRPRLLRLLDGDWRVALISAGPATGKTVLAEQWLAEGRTDCAWVTLDADAKRPEQLWLDLAAGLRQARPGTFEATWRSATLGGVGGSVPAHLLSDATQLDSPLVLVLDDLHAIGSRAAGSAFTDLVERLPPQLRLLLLTRTDPPLPLALWRARGWLAEVHQEELSFDLVESTALFPMLGEERLAHDEIRDLVGQTEGWVGALQIAAIAMRGRDATNAVHELTGRHAMLADLLDSEVVGRQPPEVQDFMLRTSILGHLDAELCDALSGGNANAQRIGELARAVPFVIALDDERSTFRYHRLLAQLLRSELERRYPGLAFELHRRAADVYEARGDLAAAIDHCAKCGDFDRAFEIFVAQAEHGWECDDRRVVHFLPDTVPVDYITESPSRIFEYSMSLGCAAGLDDRDAWLGRAERALTSQTQPEPLDEARLDALRLSRFVIDATGATGATAIESGWRALDAVERGVDLGALSKRVLPNLVRACLLAGLPDVADKALSGAAAADDLSVMVVLPALEARVALKQGSLRHAVERSASALAGARVLGVPTHIATLDARLASIAARIERNELPAARDEMPDLWSVIARHGSPAYQVLTGLHEVRLAVVQDGLDAGLDVLREVRAICGTRARPVLQARIDAAEARLRTDTGETRKAEALITRLDTESGVRCLLEARLQVGRGAGREARQTLRRAHFTNPHAGLRAELLLVRVALLDGWDPAHHLDRVVELAAPEGFVRTVHEEGDVIRRLVRRAAEASGIPEAETFAEALGAPPNCRHHDDELVAITVKEREVLRFLPTHLTNKEIAAECFMSVNTVKAHLRSIYSKVNARSRSEAVERARALGVL